MLPFRRLHGDIVKNASATEKLMGMSDDVWARHTNPWSGWSRLSAFPLIALAAWSRIWIGYWAIGLGIAVGFWIWINPRLFPAPKYTDNWMSRGVLGERVWLNRKMVPVPRTYVFSGFLLNGLAGLAALGFLFGLMVLHLPTTIIGMLISMAAKLCFVGMVGRLYDKMAVTHPPYRAWMRRRPKPPG